MSQVNLSGSCPDHMCLFSGVTEAYNKKKGIKMSIYASNSRVGTICLMHSTYVRVILFRTLILMITDSE